MAIVRAATGPTVRGARRMPTVPVARVVAGTGGRRVATALRARARVGQACSVRGAGMASRGRRRPGPRLFRGPRPGVSSRGRRRVAK